MAMLVLGERARGTRGARLRRASQARSFLVEAATSLSRARIYVPGVRTYAIPFIMASECEPDAEIRRLHNIATRLLWQNHRHLPAKLQATPLPPDEEAQLAVLVKGLSKRTRWHRGGRFRWATSALAGAFVTHAAGFALTAAGLTAAGLAFLLWSLTRDSHGL